MAWFSADSAFSSSSYIRKRLPHPNARMETFAPVRPRVRVGSGVVPAGWASAKSLRSERLTPAAVPNPTRSRNFLRERSFCMLDSSMIFLPIAASIPVGHSGAGFGEPAGEAPIDSHILPQIPELAGGQARFSRLVFSDGSRQRRREGARGLQKAIWKAVREGH